MPCRFVCAAAIAAGCLFGASVASANLLVNPSFEQPPLSSGQISVIQQGQVIGAGWTVLPLNPGNISVVIGTPYQGGATIWPNASNGQNILYVGDSLRAVSIEQTVALDPATTYRLTFDLAGFSNSGTGSSGARAIVDVLRGGSSVLGAPVTFDRPEVSGFATQMLDFTTAAAGDYQLILRSPEGFGTNVDNFSLVVVPEPASLGLMLGGLTLVTRRRA